MGNGKTLITDEEIEKALQVLGEKVDLQEPHNLQGQGNVDYEELVKSINDEIDSKFESFANISKSIVEDYHEFIGRSKVLDEQNDTLLKAVERLSTRLEDLSKSVDEIANSPINKLVSFKKAAAVERFGKGSEGNGKETISLTKDKRKVLSALSKSIDTKEGQQRLGDVVACIENGFIDQSNAAFILKSVTNEIGGDYNITL